MSSRTLLQRSRSAPAPVSGAQHLPVSFASYREGHEALRRVLGSEQTRLGESGQEPSPVGEARPIQPPPAGAVRLQRKCAACEQEEKHEGVLQRTADGSGLRVQRKCAACEQEEKEEHEGVLQRAAVGDGLAVGPANDVYEREADRVASSVMAGGSERVQGRVGGNASAQRNADGAAGGGAAPSLVGEVLRSEGTPLDSGTRTFMESRLGHDFSDVRVHADARADASARTVGALAYTVGQDIAFRSGQYAPDSEHGRRLIAHELAHVVQQGAGTVSPIVQRQVVDGPMQVDPMDDPRMHAPGAPNAATCGAPSHCPATFCQPYSSAAYARYQLAKQRPILLAGIAVAVSSRVLPLWRDYLDGGSPARDLSSTFAADFTSSRTTRDTTTFLHNELRTSLRANPPTFPAGVDTVTVDIPSRIGPAINQLGIPGNAYEMNFNIPSEVPGNLAGGIGTNQLACQSGAQPSPFNDERTARGTASVTRDAAGNLTVVPAITFTVRDTIDLCPGDCGTSLEQIATVPMSQFEATGIAGDVPFSVQFPAPAGSFTIPTAVPPVPSPSPSPAPKSKP